MGRKEIGTPTLEQLEAELRRETHKHSYGRVLRSKIGRAGSGSRVCS